MSTDLVPSPRYAQRPDGRILDAKTVAALRTLRRRERLARMRGAGIAEPTGAQSVTWVGDLQQGDGGKGAMVDRLAPFHQVIVRSQGGDNAGHTTVFAAESGDEMVLKNHILPSGLRHPGRVGVLSNGVLVNAERLDGELDALARTVPDIRSRVFVSGRAHLILPMHRHVDGSQEDLRALRGSAVGTTRRGIGPANVSKVNRMGIRVNDLTDWDVVEARVRENAMFFGVGEEHVAENVKWLAGYRGMLLDLATDSVRLVDDLVSEGFSVLFEGAQGPLIDLEHGIYPYVTTSPTAAYSVFAGSGLDIAHVTHRVGVLKAYQTMVGNGAFPTEDDSALGDRLRADGAEFGTTTGRSRRCGWLDLVHARWAVELNGYTSVVLTKLDVLDGFERVGVCVGYERDGETVVEFQPEHAWLTGCRPIFRYFDGWLASTRDVTEYEKLPEQARDFVDFVGAYLGVEVAGVTKGPRDVDMLLRPGGELTRLVARS